METVNYQTSRKLLEYKDWYNNKHAFYRRIKEWSEIINWYNNQVEKNNPISNLNITIGLNIIIG